jgi:hypothetical protein
MPGLAYQLGILFAAPTNSIEFALQKKIGYSWALAVFEIVNIVFLSITLSLGSEDKGRAFVREDADESAKLRQQVM